MTPTSFFAGHTSAARRLCSSSASSKKYVCGSAIPVEMSISQLSDTSAHFPAAMHLLASKMILYGASSTGGASRSPISLGSTDSSAITPAMAATGLVAVAFDRRGRGIETGMLWSIHGHRTVYIRRRSRLPV
jgi:hypothetical protein